MYLPLGARGAFRWYLDTLYRSPTRGRSVLKSALRALAAGCDGLAAFAPCYAMTAVRGIERPSALVERACLDGVWTSATPPQPVLLANGDAEWNRIVLLLFESNAPVPTTAIKLPRTPVFNPQIEWEHDLLGELGADLAPPLRGSIPTSTVFRWNDLAVSAETCVTGSSLSTRTGLHANGVLEDLHLTTKWLATFHRQTTIDRVSARKWVTQRLVNGMCSDYAATFGLTAAEKQLFAMLSDRLDVADAHVLPIVWQHADFGPWNVYRDQDDVSVIDWEVARRGPALTDLLYFVTHWSAARATCATDAEHLDHFASLFCGGIPRGMLTHAIHAEIGEYMRRVDVPSSLFAFLLLYTFLEQALDCARRLATIQDMAAASRARNRYVGYVGVLARHADRLFARGSITDGV
jgi:hypothetical protein